MGKIYDDVAPDRILLILFTLEVCDPDSKVRAIDLANAEDSVYQTIH